MSFFAELKRRNVFRVGIAYGVAAWVLLQVADLVLENINAPEWVIQTMMLMVGLGFIAALVIAWAYEMTPEGIKKEADVDRSQTVVNNTGKKLDKIIIGFLVIAVAVLLLERSMDQEPTALPQVETTSEAAQATEESTATNAQTSVAVLPFTNMSADADNEYFSDGISEELLNLLVRIKGLRVPSRTSSFAFKGMNMDIKEIAQHLEVSHILEGSVRKAGNRVRVTAQLIDVSTDTHLWSETYDRELEDIFAIQDEIANNIIDALKDVLGTEATVTSRASDKPTEDLEAYQEYLRGRHLFMQRGLGSLNLSMQLLQSATTRDPEFSEAWAQLSQTAATLHGWDPLNDVNATAVAIESGLKALLLDPKSANAMSGLALAYYNQNRWQEALDLLEKAEPLSTDSTPIYWYGLMLQNAGYLEEAREKFAAAEKIDPVYAQLQYWFGLNDMVFGRLDDARMRFQRAIDGSNPNGAEGMTWLNLHQDKPTEAAHYLNEAKMYSQAGLVGETDPENFRVMIASFSDSSLRDEAIQAALELSNIPVLAYYQAFDEIMAHEEQKIAANTITEANIDLGSYFWSPQFKPIRQMPGFKQMIIDLGLLEVWKTRGWPDLCKPVGDDDFVCK